MNLRDVYTIEAIRLIIDSQKAHVSTLQRDLNIGFHRAMALLEELEEMGIISEPDKDNVRYVHVKNIDEVVELLKEQTDY